MAFCGGDSNSQQAEVPARLQAETRPPQWVPVQRDLEPLTSPKRERWFDWLPTSASQLEASEAEILSVVDSRFRVQQCDVNVSGGHVHCLRVTREGAEPINEDPVVVLHGFAGGAAMWARNMEGFLSAEGAVGYFIDCPGFGRSTRYPFKGSSPEDGEDFFLSILAKFAEALSLDRFTIVGHSMGGFLAAKYTLKHPQQIKRLILVDPWGIQERPEDFEERMSQRWGWKGSVIRKVAGWGISPLSVPRLLGPFGPGLIPKVRPDIAQKWGSAFSRPEAIGDYIWHCNSQTPATGDEAFMAMQQPVAYAHRPVSSRFGEFPPDLPIHFIYGDSTWMSSDDAREFAARRPGTTLEFISGARHHPYADNAPDFNKALQRVLGPAVF